MFRLPAATARRAWPICSKPPLYRDRRCFSLASVAEPTNKVQIYISRSPDPYLNLSIEHYFLQKSPPDSVVLFLYANRPCVVIGRNQNPWLEVNLGLVRRAPPVDKSVHELEHEWEEPVATAGDGTGLDVVDIVRRRSGGGTVFHDLGNVNYSVLCPPAEFDRDKHAEMVVQALRGLNAGSVRVNERHDIVIDNDDGPPPPTMGAVDAGSGASSVQNPEQKQTFKISGSAYKLTRNRSLHHGTCLLASPNLASVGRLLRSPAEPYIKARGVASVRSPIRNVGIAPRSFRDAVIAEFRTLYRGLGAADVRVVSVGSREALEVPELMRGYEELRSKEWIYTQTPQFTLSTHPTADDPRPRAVPVAYYLPHDFRLEMTVRHGQITAVSGGSPDADLPETLVSRYLHEVSDWRAAAGDERAGRWLNEVLGNAVDDR